MKIYKNIAYLTTPTKSKANTTVHYFKMCCYLKMFGLYRFNRQNNIVFVGVLWASKSGIWYLEWNLGQRSCQMAVVFGVDLRACGTEVVCVGRQVLAPWLWCGERGVQFTLTLPPDSWGLGWHSITYKGSCYRSFSSFVHPRVRIRQF